MGCYFGRIDEVETAKISYLDTGNLNSNLQIDSNFHSNFSKNNQEFTECLSEGPSCTCPSCTL
jgi:hypothetical protein